MSPYSDFKQLFTQDLNLRAVDKGAYLNLPNDEWACKIMTNILFSSGIEENVDENKKEEFM